MKKLCGLAPRVRLHRLSSIQVHEVEKPVREFLGGLGKLARPWLTELEEILLTELEKMS